MRYTFSKLKLTIAGFGLFFCFQSFSQTTNEFFEVTSATSQSWAGGAAGSGGGTNYVFNLVIKKDTRLEFDTVWICQGDTIRLSITQYTIKDEVNKKGTTLTIYASQYFSGEAERYYGYVYVNKVSKPPFDFKGSALLSFFVDGNTYYYAVEKMLKLPPIAYP
jgi:hypothetical protein